MTTNKDPKKESLAEIAVDPDVWKLCRQVIAELVVFQVRVIGHTQVAQLCRDAASQGILVQVDKARQTSDVAKFRGNRSGHFVSIDDKVRCHACKITNLCRQRPV